MLYNIFLQWQCGVETCANAPSPLTLGQTETMLNEYVYTLRLTDQPERYDTL